MKLLTRTSATAIAAALLTTGVPGLSAAYAQDTAGAAAADAADTEEDPIIVLGTRRTDRTVTDSASPVDVVSATDLTARPTANMLDSLSSLVPSFFVGQNSISDASTFVRSPSLRGLPADNILVMLNGKRYNRSALVQVFVGADTGLSFGSHGSDLSAIPSIAIQSLQVLREGATAQYGTDAIAGVLNYGLREDAGFELVARYGQNYEGDGHSYQIAGNVGFKLGDGGFINLSGEYNNDGQTSRGATRPTAVVFAAENPTLASQLPHYPLPVQIWGNSPSEGTSWYSIQASMLVRTANSTCSATLRTARPTKASTSVHPCLERGRSPRPLAGPTISADVRSSSTRIIRRCARPGTRPAPLAAMC